MQDIYAILIGIVVGWIIRGLMDSYNKKKGK